MRRKQIRTANQEMYEKLSSLNFQKEVVLNNVPRKIISNILNNINRHERIIKKDKNKLIKILPTRFDVYLKPRNRM